MTATLPLDPRRNDLCEAEVAAVEARVRDDDEHRDDHARSAPKCRCGPRAWGEIGERRCCRCGRDR
jgi:hypothetical protein